MSCSTTLSLLLFVSSLLPFVFAIVPGSDNWAQQGFYFDWNNATSPLPTSITGQCENINIKWYRGNGVGPDPVAPYVFKIYSSMHINPFIVNAGSQLEAKLPIPFDPYSRYILCMTDSTGISGGCQDLYTVYPTGNTTCTNFTMPADILGVRMTSIETGGSLSRFGWPARCSDLQFDLEAGVEGGIVGTPPYTLTVAPALRTPVNITFEKTVRWTIMLDHGHPFFVSIVDSKGPQPQPPHEVYVVHHDAGLPPPVTVITHHGTVVTELPPGYDHLIPTPQPPNLNYHGESGGMEEHDASTSMRRLKNQPSTSAMTNVDPQIQLQIQRPDGSGLALVHAEDVPLSAVSPTSPNPNTFPLPPPLPSQSIRTAETHLLHS
ncbi:hypothetical protein FRC18_008438 [Serendipita sp. 400]|nr:hypothetical protein FRC18_008438 [Serendipita sp. 400]